MMAMQTILRLGFPKGTLMFLIVGISMGLIVSPDFLFLYTYFRFATENIVMLSFYHEN